MPALTLILSALPSVLGALGGGGSSSSSSSSSGWLMVGVASGVGMLFLLLAFLLTRGGKR